MSLAGAMGGGGHGWPRRHHGVIHEDPETEDSIEEETSSCGVVTSSAKSKNNCAGLSPTRKASAAPAQRFFFRDEFDELDRLCIDTIQRKTASSSPLVNRRRNRYH